MNRNFYTLLFYLILPVILLRLLWRAVRSPAYARRWAERLGFVSGPREQHPRQKWIWLHAVSVGESIAAAPLIRQLIEQQPDYGIVVTTMTPTGSDRVREMFADKVCHVYAPYDYPGAVQRFLKTFQPELVILMETELWPNLVHYSRQQGARVMVLNARLSEKSFRGYEKFAALGKPMLQQIDCIAAQGPADAERFRRLGAPDEVLHITGSLKFEVKLPHTQAQTSRQLASLIEDPRPVWIAASTREGEEEKVLQAFKQVQREIPDVLLVMVPRHPERFDAVEKLCRSQSYRVVRRSSGESLDALVPILLGDSMGEMPAYYSLADVAFVGGSLVETGCQNVLEPASLGLPVIAGPSQYNFQLICEQLEEAGALRTVADEDALAMAVIELIKTPELRRQMGEAGKRTVVENRGALQRSYQLVVEQLGH